MQMKYDYKKLTQVFQSTLDWLGEERFSTLPVTQLEKMIREREAETPLPSRSQFRAALHGFRVKRWPHTAPRRRV